MAPYLLRQALGFAPGEAAREMRAAGVMVIPIPATASLDGVTGVEDARGVAGIEDVEITIPVTHEVVQLPEGNRYLGFIFAKGRGPDAVEAALRGAHRRLSFDIR